MNEELFQKVNEKLREISPFLEVDEGGVELIDVNETGIVKVKLTGACENCPMSSLTLRAGIERALIKEIPQVKRVEAVNL